MHVALGRYKEYKMNETNEMWRDYREHIKSSKLDRYTIAKNRLTIEQFPGEWRDDNLFMIRKSGWPKVNYWPTTCKWKNLKTNIMHYGSEEEFIRWCLEKKE